MKKKTPTTKRETMSATLSLRESVTGSCLTVISHFIPLSSSSTLVIYKCAYLHINVCKKAYNADYKYKDRHRN